VQYQKLTAEFQNDLAASGLKATEKKAAASAALGVDHFLRLSLWTAARRRTTLTGDLTSTAASEGFPSTADALLRASTVWKRRGGGPSPRTSSCRAAIPLELTKSDTAASAKAAASNALVTGAVRDRPVAGDPRS